MLVVKHVHFVPVAEEVTSEYNLEYIYVELSELDQQSYLAVQDLTNFSGVPHYVVVAENELIIEASGFRDKDGLVKLLQDNNVIE